jgi:thioredoxin
MPVDWSVKELIQANFKEESESDRYPVFIDFYAEWCSPCRMMEPMIEDLAEEYHGKVLFRKLNTDLAPKVSAGFNVSGIPTFIIFNEGKEAWRSVGAIPKRRLREALDRVITTQ